MSRSSRRRRSARARESGSFSSDGSLRRPQYMRPSDRREEFDESLTDDRRFYAMDVPRQFVEQPLRTLRAFYGSAARAAPRAPRRRAAAFDLSLGRIPFLPWRFGLRLYPRLRVCVARKKRREVLFALLKAGFRGSAPGGPGGYRRSVDSNYSCGG